MELQSDQLRALVAVVDRGTFEAAAKQLKVTPSAISQRIKALETAAGRVLVERSKPVRMTTSGAVVLRLARQLALLEHDARAVLQDRPDPDAHVRVAIAVNADSLATWVLPALARVADQHRVAFAIHSADESQTAQLLRNGTVMAAITSEAQPVQGCTSRKLGRMRYRPMAQAAFATRWFPDGMTADALAVAPVIAFDAKDDLQDRCMRRITRRRLDPPRHLIPASADFTNAVRLGLGWGMISELQSADTAYELVELDPGRVVDVPLYWQQWKLQSALLDTVTEALRAAAASTLHAGR